MPKPIQAILLAATTALSVVGLGGTASAAPSTYDQPIVSSVSGTVLASFANGGFALVQARYRCYGGDVGTHLFIAVKQGPDVTPENPSSSETTTAFYSTNWNTDGPSLTVHCDGASHTGTFRVRNDPYWWDTAASPALVDGAALVQFCLFDSKATEDLSSGFAANYEMKTVRVLG
jgi:hypothetical protein